MGVLAFANAKLIYKEEDFMWQIIALAAFALAGIPLVIIDKYLTKGEK